MAVSEPTGVEVETAQAIRRAVPIRQRSNWETWRADFQREWRQDEHISIIGPTATGKSTLMLELLKIRRFKVFVMTKPADDKLEGAMARQHYIKVSAFPSQPPDDISKYLLWPPGSGTMDTDGRDDQRLVIRDAFQKIFEGPRGGQPGRWCVALDEARYIADPSYLGLRREVNQMLIQGRSLRIAMVLAFQRPSWVPPEAYDQASFLFLAGDNDRRNVQRFREIGGVDGAVVAATVQRLKVYEWCAVDARPGSPMGIQVIKLPRGL